MPHTLTKCVMQSLKHTNVGQTKFISPTHNKKDIKSKENKVDFYCRVDLVKLRFI